MQLPFLALLALLLAGCSAYGPGLRRGRDVYPDLAALRAANTEGLDYSREAYPRGSDAAVFALHGGDIEAGTALVARRLAGKDFNLYIFSGWHGDSGDLHVTAVNFDDPAAVAIAASSVLAVSVHAQADRGSWVCVGGSNAAAAAAVAARLEGAGFAAETPCRRLPGASPRNIVNRARAGGVQLELTLRLLRRLETSPEDLSKFTEAVRMAILETLASVKAETRQETTS